MHDLYGTCFHYNEILKNQPSNSTSWSDNALCLLVIVAVFQVSNMPFQSMNSTPKLFRLTLINASRVLRFRLVLLSLFTQFCFEKPRSQTAVLVGITSMAYHSNTRVGQLILNSRSRPQKTQASCILWCWQTEDNIFRNSSNSSLVRSTRIEPHLKCVTNWFNHSSCNTEVRILKPDTVTWATIKLHCIDSQSFLKIQL